MREINTVYAAFKCIYGTKVNGNIFELKHKSK